MRTAQKIAAAKLAYRVIHGLRALGGRGDETVVTRHGIRYALDLAQGIDFAIYLFGQFEPATAAAYARHVRPGATVLDIGANIGAHSLRLAQQAGPGGRVIACEPTAYGRDKLRRTLALNPALAPRVELIQCFLGARDEAAVVDRKFRDHRFNAVEAVGTLWHSFLSIAYGLMRSVTHHEAAM